MTIWDRKERAGSSDRKVRLTRKSDAYWVVTIANPPFNVLGPAEVLELQAVVDQLEADPRLHVVVFDNAVPDYFIAHYDLLKPLSDSTGLVPGRPACIRFLTLWCLSAAWTQ